MRISGVNIPDNKRIDIALTYIFGIGRHRAAEIVKAVKIDGAKRAKDLSGEEVGSIQSYIEKHYQIEGELKQIIRQNINRLKDIKTYRGIRLAKHLPAHGQRTKSNSRTVRGNVRKTAGSGKRKIELK